jgi:anthranilate phosphoribosyltransferase
MARSLALLGSRRAWVVHGADGLDELSTTGFTKVAECRDGVVHTFYVHPAEFGLPRVSPADLKGGDAAANAAIITSVLNGDRGPARDVVLLNAGAALFVAERVGSVVEGIAAAGAAVDRGDARQTLARMVECSNATVAA